MPRLVRLARTPVPLWGSAIALIGLPILVSVLAIPLRVTVDGIMYVSSAKSFFTDDFAKTYAWFREPGYPFFLSVVHAVSDQGFLLIIVQAFMLGAAVFIGLYCAVRALGRSRPSLGLVAILTLLILNPMYLIYSALVLQQAQFAFQLSLIALSLSWVIRTPPWLSRWVLLAGVLVNYALSVWTSIGWIYLSLVPVAAVIVITLWKAFRGWTPLQRRRVAIPALAVLSVVTLIGVYRLGLLTYGGWTSIRDTYSVAAEGIPTQVIAPLSKLPGIPTPWLFGQRALAIMHVGTVHIYTYENDLFLNAQLIRGYAHAEWDVAFQRPPYSDFALGYFRLTDPVPFLFRPLSILARIASPLYSAVYLAALVPPVIALVRKRWELLVILMVPFYFIGVYAASNSPIDRYGIPAYGLASIGVAVVIAAVVDRIARRRERRRPVPAES